MAITAQFTATPKNHHVKITGASGSNTSRTGAGTDGVDRFQLASFGANGGRIDNISIKAAGTLVTTTVGAIRFFADIAGTKYLLKEQAVSATVPSASTPGFNVDLTGLNWVFDTATTIWVTSQVVDTAGNQFDIVATFAGDF